MPKPLKTHVDIVCLDCGDLQMRLPVAAVQHGQLARALSLIGPCLDCGSDWKQVRLPCGPRGIDASRILTNAATGADPDS